MNKSFFKYFFSYIFKSKTRQRLLALAIFGLFISSFSLVVLQGVMGGLQKGVISRSKDVNGVGFVKVPLDYSLEEMKFLKQTLSEDNLEYLPEFEIELLVKNKDLLKPVVLHGIDLESDLPLFLKEKDFDGIILGSNLATNIKAFFDDQLILISPSHSDFLLTQIPRQSSTKFTDIVVSDLEEVDKLHAWSDLKFVQNLVRKRSINKINFYNQDDFNFAKKKYTDSLKLEFVSWENKNQSLVWALKLETTVMIILFIAMSLLVAICITSGFMIFYDKAKTDLISFWVIGLSKSSVMNLLFLFTQLISVGFILVGLVFGRLLLLVLDSKSFAFIPDIFIQQDIPVSVGFKSLLISFFVPYIISTIFSFYSFKVFKSENSSFLKLIRSVG